MLVSGAGKLVKINRKGEHTSRIKMLLGHGWSSSKEIAAAVGCSERLVRHVRLQMDLPHRRESIDRQLERLGREIREIRRFAILRLDMDKSTEPESRPRLRLV